MPVGTTGIRETQKGDRKEHLNGGASLPLVFAYVGETKGLRENFLDVGETKDLGDFSVRMRVWDGPKWHKSSVPSA